MKKETAKFLVQKYSKQKNLYMKHKIPLLFPKIRNTTFDNVPSTFYICNTKKYPSTQLLL